MTESYKGTDYKKIISHILKNWENFNFLQIDKSKIKVRVLPFRRKGPHSLLNIMFFSGNRLLLVIKFPRYQEAKLAYAAIENEARILKYLDQNKILLNHIPQVYTVMNIDGIPVLCFKAYAGDMLHQLLDKEDNLEKLDELISSGARLIPQLYIQSKSNVKTIDDAFMQKHVTDPLKLIAEHFPQEISTIKKPLDALIADKGLTNIKYSEACLHQDLNPWNILKEINGNLILFDWEDAAENGLPFMDVYNYYTICFRILFGGESEHAQKRSAEEKKKRADVLLKNFSRFIEKYCQNLNIPLKLKDFFFILFAIQTTHFFLQEKRREVNYSKSWLSLLLNISPADCFEESIKRFIQK